MATAPKIDIEPANPSGLIPLEYNVVVLPREVDEKTKGGIILAQETKDKEQLAEQQGTIVAVSQYAFDQWPDNAPGVGDLVVHARYSGILYDGADGRKYRIMKDKDIFARVEG